MRQAPENTSGTFSIQRSYRGQTPRTPLVEWWRGRQVEHPVAHVLEAIR